MTLRFPMKEFCLSISLHQTLSYLDSRGWKTRSDSGLIACEGPIDDAGHPIVAFIPDDESCPDYPLRLEDLIFVMCQLEDRPAAEIAREMASVSVVTEEMTRHQDADVSRNLKPIAPSGRALDVQALKVKSGVAGVVIAFALWFTSILAAFGLIYLLSLVAADYPRLLDAVEVLVCAAQLPLLYLLLNWRDMRRIEGKGRFTSEAQLRRQESAK